ncbi:MAG: type II toxin-antitoxin system RelE/ParE family toxin [Spirochaetaceae bacterium]|nr:type II toxin-antitoxin system RelE/ParE family toxin [Spirochaetaceae bacterium]
MSAYKVILLPIASQDLLDIVTYITEKLHAPQAAEAFVLALDKLVEQLSQHPYSYPLYLDKIPLEYEVRRAVVKNYLVFYAVTNNTVEIHRILYGGRDMEQVKI